MRVEKECPPPRPDSFVTFLPRTFAGGSTRGGEDDVPTHAVESHVCLSAQARWRTTVITITRGLVCIEAWLNQ